MINQCNKYELDPIDYLRKLRQLRVKYKVNYTLTNNVFLFKLLDTAEEMEIDITLEKVT